MAVRPLLRCVSNIGCDALMCMLCRMTAMLVLIFTDIQKMGRENDNEHGNSYSQTGKSNYETRAIISQSNIFHSLPKRNANTFHPKDCKMNATENARTHICQTLLHCSAFSAREPSKLHSSGRGF